EQRSQIPRRRAAAAILVLSIISLHFTAMAGTTIVPQSFPDNPLAASDTTDLAVAVTPGTRIILRLCGGATGTDLRADRETDRFRALVAATFEGILIHRAGVILDGNDAFCTLARTDLDSIKGKNLLEFFGQESARFINPLIAGTAVARREATLVA